MIGGPEYTLTLPPPCPTRQDHLRQRNINQLLVRALNARPRSALMLVSVMSAVSQTVALGRPAVGLPIRPTPAADARSRVGPTAGPKQSYLATGSTEAAQGSRKRALRVTSEISFGAYRNCNCEG